MSKFIQRYHRRQFVTWVSIVSVFGVLLLLNVVWLGVGPPQRVSISSGDPDVGAFHTYALEYKEKLDELGLITSISTSKGSQQNLDRLINKEVDVAFVQAGLYDKSNKSHEKLRALAAVYLSPVWVFYRKELGDLELISDFSKVRIAIGPEGSGTHETATRLLKVNGINIDSDNVESLDLDDAAKALKDNKVQIAVFVLTPRSPQVVELLHHPSIRILDIRRSLAYSRRFPEFTAVTLGEGTVNLEQNIPNTQHRLIATSVLLMTREDLHARAVEQILIAARETHKHAGVITDPGKYPSLDRVTMPIHPAAQQFMRSGESFTTKILPYAVMRWVLRIQLLIIPLIAIWLPLVKFFPALYQFRINSLLKLHYGALREVEGAVNEAESEQELAEAIGSLDELQNDMENLSKKIPAHLQCDVYNWRLHIGLVKDAAEAKLEEYQTSPSSNKSKSSDNLDDIPRDDASNDA